MIGDYDINGSSLGGYAAKEIYTKDPDARSFILPKRNYEVCRMILLLLLDD